MNARFLTITLLALAFISTHSWADTPDEKKIARIRELEAAKAKLQEQINQIDVELAKLRGQNTIQIVKKIIPCDIAELEKLAEIKKVSYDEDNGRVVWQAVAKTKLDRLLLSLRYDVIFYDANGAKIATKRIFSRPEGDVEKGDTFYIHMLDVSSNKLGDVLEKTVRVVVKKNSN